MPIRVSASGAEIGRLARFFLVATAADRLAGFYERALGFHRLGEKRLSGAAFEYLMGVEGDATSITLGLGREIVELVQFDRPGQAYPEGSSSSDLIFQHFAIVVVDMDAAYRRLSGVAGWTAISSAGPQRLPETSGGVTAFKFRDPDGHPLELLAFPPGKAPPHWQGGIASDPYLGLDHSAISVFDSGRSIAFYHGLGLTIFARSLNQGPEQARLDSLQEPLVEVTALAPPQATPHVELLRYRGVAEGRGIAVANNDVAATRLVFEAYGHRLLIVPPID
jgi:catechol 2,3-dioxygenase-like lactoylglutathione lyase family enzyme